MPPPPPRPDDDPPPPVNPSAGWEPVEPPPPAHDPLLDDPLFAELVEAKALPDLTVEPVTPPPLPVAEPLEEVPVAEEVTQPQAVPVARPRPRPVAPPPPPPRRPEEPVEAPRPQVFAACAVLGCFGLGFLGALGFLAYAAIALLSGLPDSRSRTPAEAVAARPGPVDKTTYASQQGTIALQGRVDAVGRAAGGRYLLLRTGGGRQLAVFDPNGGRIVHTFDLGESGTLFAGSASKLFVYRAKSKGAELERWDLETHQREWTAEKPAGVAQADALVAGAGADGPVYLVSVPTNGKASVRELDPDTLREKSSVTIDGWQWTEGLHVRASDDGATLGVTTAAGAQVLRFTDRAAVLTPLGGRGRTPRLATPAHDGRLVFTPYGLFDPATGAPKDTLRDYAFPTAHGADLFLTQGRKATGALTAEIRLRLTASPDDYVDLENVAGPTGLEAGDVSALPPDQRVHLWPAAGLAAVITPGSQSQLVLSKVDVPELLRGLDNPYLVVGSDPPAWAGRGGEWRYRPVIWTNERGFPAVTVVEGPKGMQVRPSGEIVWAPGADAPRTSRVQIRVVVGGKTTEQRFRVTVLDEHDHDEDDE